MKASHAVLAAGLAATVLAAAFAPEPDADVVPSRAPRPREPALARATSAAPPSATGTPVAVLAIRPRSAPDAEPNSSFGLITPPPARPIAPAAPALVAPQPAPVPASQPAATQAPALPYRVLGRYVESGEQTVFLQNEDRSIAARVGDLLDGAYRVESIDAGVLTLLYLPLNLRQTLPVGDAP